MQRLTELFRWRARNPGQVQVVAVHVPRFDAERDPQYVLKSIRSYGISLPIIHDADWRAWRQYGIQSWPTVLLIDETGHERERLVGLTNDLESRLVALSERPSSSYSVRSFRENDPEPHVSLRFPAGLAATGDRLYIADSGHHRVLECSLDGRVRRQFGLGLPDFIDGTLSGAAFNRPQGLVLERDTLYVADVDNHALRRIDLMTGHVSTLCGNGRPGKILEGHVVQPNEFSLHYPQDLAVAHNQLYIAMAGDNQVWRFDLGTNELFRCAGNGALDMEDGEASKASFAQPMGIVAVQHTLYVCDALGSALRSVQLQTRAVQTMIGSGLWKYGNQDGQRANALMQYPRAISLSQETPVLWIADAGNGSLRSLRLGGGELSTESLPRTLNIPSALAVAEGTVWIAETGSHNIVRYDIASSKMRDIPIEE
jgi:hypothetical protein